MFIVVVMHALLLCMQFFCRRLHDFRKYVVHFRLNAQVTKKCVTYQMQPGIGSEP